MPIVNSAGVSYWSRLILHLSILLLELEIGTKPKDAIFIKNIEAMNSCIHNQIKIEIRLAYDAKHQLVQNTCQ